MTLSQLLDAFGFEFEQKEGKFFVYDQKDDSFEETADTVKGVINIISGHIESDLQGALEDIYMSTLSTKADTTKWTWKDWASFLKANNSDEEHHYWYYLIEICEALADIDTIEIK